MCSKIIGFALPDIYSDLFILRFSDNRTYPMIRKVIWVNYTYQIRPGYFSYQNIGRIGKGNCCWNPGLDSFSASWKITTNT